MGKQIDPLHIYLQAERFLYTDERLRGPGITREDTAYVMVPCLVMQAFSIELYLKCLIALEGHPVPVGHNLKNLFTRLNGKTQKELAALWLADTDNRVRIRRGLPPHLHEAVSDDIREALSHGARAFEQLRYAFEGELTCRFYIDSVPRMLRSMIWRRKPEWRGVGPGIPEPL